MHDRKDRNRTLVTAGEFFLDLIFFDLERLPRLGEELKTDHFAQSAGGGAAITACAAARLGRAARLLTVWGDSAMDSQARAGVERLGVDCSSSRTLAATHSGLTVAVSTREDRYFLTSPGANRHVEGFLLEDESARVLARAAHVHLALTPSRWPPFVDLLRSLGRAGVSTSWDLGWDPAAAALGLEQLSSSLSVLFLNEMEALEYTGAGDPEEALRRLATPATTVVIKRGASGAMAVSGPGEAVSIPALEVTAIDSTGAGDAFNGGFLHAWMDGRSLRECLAWGNVTGGLSTRLPGGIPALPSLEEFTRGVAQLEQRMPESFPAGGDA